MVKLKEQPGVTLYYQLKTILRGKIASGVWKPGDKIDNEMDIAAEYGVSRATVRQAILDLAQEGLVERKRGKGTFVEVQRYAAVINLQFSYPPEYGDRHETISQEVIQLDEKTAKEKGMRPGAAVCRIRRLRYFGDEPAARETVYLPEAYFPGVMEAGPIRGRLFDFIQNHYHVALENFYTEIEPVILYPSELRLFGLKGRNAGLILTRVCLNEEGKVILWHHSLFRGDRCRFLFK